MKRILRHVWDLRNACKYFSLSHWFEWKAAKNNLTRQCIFRKRLNLKRQYIKLVKKTIQLLRGIVQRGQLKPSLSKSTTFRTIHIIALKDVLSYLFETLVLPCCDALLSFLSSYRNISSQKSANFYIYTEILESKGFANSQRPRY